MRHTTFLTIFLAIGCGGSAHQHEDATVAESAHEPGELYTDDEIRKLVKSDIDRVPSGDETVFSILDMPCLDVVPNGDSRPRGDVFKELGIDDRRIRNFAIGGFNMVVFLSWQVSPSYDICCMSATNDPDNNGVDETDPKRKVYGIRLVRRSPPRESNANQRTN